MNQKFLLTAILLLLALLTVSACGQGTDLENRSSGSKDNNKSENMTNEPSDSDSATNEETAKEGNELWEKTGLKAPTGVWFMHNGEGVFGYTLPFGTQKAGEELIVGLYGHSANGDILERTVGLQVIETTENLEKINIVFQEEKYVEKITGDHSLFTVTVPEKENVHYVFNLEIVNEAGEEEDTMLSVIKVPAQELNASLSTEINKDELTLTVNNEGPTDLFFGKYYTLEKQENGSWQEVRLQEAFEDIGIILNAKESYVDKINIAPLKKGTYRILKDVSVDGLDLHETLTSQFEIK